MNPGPEYPPLDGYLARRLEDLDPGARADLAEWVAVEVYDETWEQPFVVWPTSPFGGTGSGTGSGAGTRDRWPEEDEWRSMDPDERIERCDDD